MYANGAAGSVTTKATSIAITSTSTVNARLHYKDDTGDHYIALDDLTKTLTDNKDKLNQSDFPSTADKFSAADIALIPEGYHLVTNPNDDTKLEVTIVNSDHADYGTDDPNETAAFGATSKYYFDGDIVQYELVKDTKQTVKVHYIDVSGSNKKTGWTATDGTEVSGAVQTLNGTSGTAYTNTITVPANYVEVGHDDGSVSGNYDETANTGDTDSQVQDYNVYVVHHVTHGTATSTRTINYVVKNGTTVEPDKAPAAHLETITWQTSTDDVTGEVMATAKEAYQAVDSPTVTGYTPDQETVAQELPKSALLKNVKDESVTVTYTADPAKIAVTYVDDVENGKVVEGTTLDGLVDKPGTFNVIVPNNYELSKGQSDKVAYTFTPNDGTIIIHLSHQIAHTTTITTRTINYFIQGTTTPVHASEVQPLTWNITTDKVTGATVAVPEGGYPAVKSPLVSGYTPDQPSVGNDYPGAVVGKSAGNTTVTVYYTANPVVPTPPTTPETPDTTPTTDGDTVPNEPNGETTDNGRVPNQGSAGTNGTGSDISSGTGVTEQTGQSGLTEIGSNARSVSSQQTTDTSGNTVAKLPQTNEQNANVWTSLGLGLMSIMSLLGLAKRKKHEND